MMFIYKLLLSATGSRFDRLPWFSNILGTGLLPPERCSIYHKQVAYETLNLYNKLDHLV